MPFNGKILEARRGFAENPRRAFVHCVPHVPRIYSVAVCLKCSHCLHFGACAACGRGGLSGAAPSEAPSALPPDHTPGFQLPCSCEGCAACAAGASSLRSAISLRAAQCHRIWPLGCPPDGGILSAFCSPGIRTSRPVRTRVQTGLVYSWGNWAAGRASSAGRRSL